MLSKQSSQQNLGPFLVNGAKCEVSVDDQGISWWPLSAGNTLRVTQQVRRIGQKGRNHKRVEFAQIIGIKVSPKTTAINAQVIDEKEFKRLEELESADNKKKDASNVLIPTDQGCDNFQGNKIKVYYSNRNKNRSGQLLNLKKLTIRQKRNAREFRRHSKADQQVNDKENVNQRVETATTIKINTAINQVSKLTVSSNNHLEGSGPPSCYVSEGSNSHLSSLSSTFSSAAASTRSPASLPLNTPVELSAFDNDELSSLSSSSMAASGLSSSSATSAATAMLTANSATQPPIQRLSQMINEALELRQKQRPRRLLIFVNPFGGKGKAVQLYKSQVRPLLELAGVQVKLIITKHANHARDTIDDPLFDVDQYDGLVCVGGDGMFSELMNGLLFRYNRDKILTADLSHGNNTKANDPSSTGTGTVEDDRSLSAYSYGNNGGNHVGTAADDTLPISTSQKQQHQEADLIKGNNNNRIGSDERDPCSNSNENDSYNNKDNKNNLKKESLLKLKAKLGGIGEQFVSPSIAIGVIGAGSTDANSFGLMGTNDVITATLNIILGNQIKVDVCSVHSISDEDRLLRFVSTFVAYGYFGDVIRESERLRWLGPSRYDVTGINNLIRNRAYKGLVKILISSEDGSPLDLARCQTNCELCEAAKLRRKRVEGTNSDTNITSGRNDNLRDLDDEENFRLMRFVEKQGSFVGVNAAVTACRCPQTKKGFSPNNHLANGCADLILVRPCTRIQYIRYLLRTGWTKKSAFDLKYVEAYRCRQFEFFANQDQAFGETVKEAKITTTMSSVASSTASSSSSESSTSQASAQSSIEQVSRNSNSLNSNEFDSGALSSWNVDGEILNEQSIRVKVNNQLLRVFGTGEPPKNRNSYNRKSALQLQLNNKSA